MFDVLLLKKNVTIKKTEHNKFANLLNFEEKFQLKQEMVLIMDSMIFAKKTIDSKLLGLYSFIH